MITRVSAVAAALSLAASPAVGSVPRSHPAKNFACQGVDGCVLPVTDPPAAPTPVDAGSLPASKKLGALPVLLGLAALAGAVALASGGDGDDEPESP